MHTKSKRVVAAAVNVETRNKLEEYDTSHLPLSTNLGKAPKKAFDNEKFSNAFVVFVSNKTIVFKTSLTPDTKVFDQLNRFRSKTSEMQTFQHFNAKENLCCSVNNQKQQ